MKGSRLLTSAIVVAVNVLALLLSIALSSRIAFDPLLIFVPAVGLSVWYGGAWAGFFSIVFGFFSTDYFLTPPLYTIDLLSGDFPRLVLFVVATVLVSFLSANRKQDNEMRRRSETLMVFAVNFLALLISIYLSPRLAFDPFMLFVPVVALSAWFGGVRAAILSTIFTIVATDFFLLPPIYSIDLRSVDLPRLAIFAFLALSTTLLVSNRKLSEQIRERMEAIVDSSEDAIIGISLDGIIFSWNKGAEKIYGYSAQEAKGHPISVILLPNRLAALESILEKIKRGESISPYDVVHARKNGELVDLSVSVTPVRNKNGEVVGASGIMRDISDQKRTQEWLDNLSDAVENTSDIVFITDTQGVIEYVNPAFQTSTGYSKEEALGKTPRLFKSGKHALVFYEKLWGTITAGEVFRAEFVNRKKNGDLFYELKTIAPIKDLQGKIVRFVSTGKDITDRVLAGQTLQNQVEGRTRELSTLYDITAIAGSSTDLHTILDRSLDRILIATTANEGEIHLLDEASGRMKFSAVRGSVLSEIASMSETLELWPIGWVAKHGQPLAIADVSAGSSSAVSTPQVWNIDGWAFAGVPLSVENRVIGVLSTIREKTRPFLPEEVAWLVLIGEQLAISIERIHLLAEVRRNATLIERERLAHELHDSVTQNVYSVSLLAEAAKRFMMAGDAQTASRYLGRLGELSQQSLKEMRLLVYELRPLALADNNLIEALRQRLDSVERRAGIDARFEYNDEVKLPAPAEEALYRVAQEALNNSLTHAAAPSVTVVLHADEKCIELMVDDNGKGFDLDASRNGAGIGLGSMRHRVERLGGRFEIFSKPGEGTRVTATLPLE